MFQKFLYLSLHFDVFIFGGSSFELFPVTFVAIFFCVIDLLLLFDLIIYYKLPDHVDYGKIDIADIFFREVAGDLIQIVVEFANLLGYFMIDLDIGFVVDNFPSCDSVFDDFEYISEECV